MKRIGSLALVLIALAAVLTACGSAPKGAGAPSYDSASGRAVAPAAPAPAPATPAQSAPEASKAAPPVPGTPASAPIPETTDRKIILNAQFDLKVKDAAEIVQKLGATVRGAGGYVSETQQTGTKEQGRKITMNLRVPAGQYGPITDLIRSSGDLVGQREWTQDVTAQYVDLTARLESQTIHMAQLQKLYEKGGSIKELMDLETEIARVQGDIESMKGTLRVLDNQTSYSTITVTLYEPGIPTPLEPPKTVAERITHGFTDSWHGVVNFLGDLVVFVVSSLPVLVLLVIVFGVPGYFVLRVIRRRRKGQAGPGQTPPSSGAGQNQPPLFPQ